MADSQTDKFSGEGFFVTGALGCIGAWVVRTLVRGGAAVTVFDMAADPRRMRLIMTEDEIAQVHFVTGDIADTASVNDALLASEATSLIHLAALQVPFCRADPPLGARVNVLGTINVFEAARRAKLSRVVYASSVAVYGSSEEYPEEIVGDDAALRPRNHYGVFKQANEGNARVYWLENGVSSIGLRPHTVYGPGRDQGMTSGPTKAMLAAAAGKEYHISFGGRIGMQHARDVAEIFVGATRAPFEGAAVYNIRGAVVDMSEVVEAISAVEPSSWGRITYAPVPLPLPEGQDDSALVALLGTVPATSLADGVADTIAVFKHALAGGQISATLD